MGLSIDGLSSGLDTTSLINSLMTLEAVPQTQLKSRVADVQSSISAFQGLNASVADLATKASKAALPNALDLYAATSSSASVTTTVGAGASSGSLDFTVDQLAGGQVSVSQAMTAWPFSTMTINSGGKTVTVTPASTSMDDVVSAVNTAGAGVTASKVSVGGGQFRLQFTSTTTGSAAAFSIGNPDGTTAALTDVKTAQDAQIRLWAGVPGLEQPITSSSNTFDTVLAGVSLTVSEVSATPVHVAVARDANQISKTASDLVGAVNSVLAQISTKSTVVASTDGAGNPITSGGPFTGDSTVRSVNDAILSAASQPVNGRSPSEIGIVLTKTGTMQFDAAKFADALAKDPTGTMAAVGVIAGRVADAAKQASDPTTGLLTTKILGQQSDAKDINNQIASWDDRLAMRRATLQQTYSALEVALSGMKAQSSWLTAQLGGATSGSSGA